MKTSDLLITPLLEFDARPLATSPGFPRARNEPPPPLLPRSRNEEDPLSSPPRTRKEDEGVRKDEEEAALPLTFSRKELLEAEGARKFGEDGPISLRRLNDPPLDPPESICSWLCDRGLRFGLLDDVMANLLVVGVACDSPWNLDCSLAASAAAPSALNCCT